VLHGESDVRSADELMAEKQGQIDSFEKEKVDLLEQLKESVTKEDLMVRIRQELTEKKQEVEKLQLQLKEEKEALKAERRKLNEKQEKIDALKLQLNEEKEELEAVIRQRNEKQQEIDALKGDKQALVEHAQSKSNDSQQKLQEEMEEKEKALISLQKQLKDLQMKHVAQVSTLEEKLFALQKEKEEVETNDKDFSEEIAKMNKQIEDLWKQIESLQVCLLLSLHVFCVCTSTLSLCTAHA
jgi:chromosome segregation ATPase